MSYARQKLDTYPPALDVDVGLLAGAIDAMTDCTQACIADTDADLGEQNVTEMVTCIRLCLDCADICTATAAVISRPAGYDAAVAGPLLEACVAICKSCGDECERHARMHEHCRVCAEACRRCEQACREFLDAPGIAGRLVSWPLSYIAGIAGIPETCRPGSNQGNQMASTPTVASTTPTARPNGLP